MPNTQTENEMSDYDKAWAEDESSPSTPNGEVTHAEVDDKTPAAETANAEGAPNADPNVTEEENAKKTAESENVNRFDGWTEEQKEVYLKTERDGKANLGRLRVEQNRRTTLERELQDALASNESLKKESAVPTQFEQDHPEYAEDLRAIVNANAPVDTGVSSMDLVLTAHPDAGNVFNSNEFQEWLSDKDDAYVHELMSEDHNAVIAGLNAYKASAAEAQNPTQQLQAMADIGGAKGQPDLRQHSQMTTQEQYDLAWAED